MYGSHKTLIQGPTQQERVIQATLAWMGQADQVARNIPPRGGVKSEQEGLPELGPGEGAEPRPQLLVADW